METLKAWTATAAQWVSEHPTDVVYAAAILASFTALAAVTGGRRR